MIERLYFDEAWPAPHEWRDEVCLAEWEPWWKRQKIHKYPHLRTTLEGLLLLQFIEARAIMMCPKMDWQRITTVTARLVSLTESITRLKVAGLWPKELDEAMNQALQELEELK